MIWRVLWPDALFCAAGLVAWGAGSHRLILACAMALLLLGARVSPWRLELSERARSRSNDWTFVLIALAAVWYWLQRQSLAMGFGVQLLTLCPLLLYPKLLMWACSRESAPSGSSRDGAAVARAWIESQFAFSRRHLDRRKSLSFPSIHFFLSLFIAAFALPAPSGACAIVAGSIARALAAGWNRAQSPKRSLAASAGALVLAAGATLWLASGVAALQGAGESFFSQAWSHRGDGAGSGAYADTRIGSSGDSINLGGALVARVEWALAPGAYLRDGVFASPSFDGSSWRLAQGVGRSDGELATLSPSAGGSFILESAPQKTKPLQAKILMSISKAKSSLALPVGSTEIFGWPLDSLLINRMGVSISPAPAGYASLGATFFEGRDNQPTPSPADLDPTSNRALLVALDEFLDQAGARGLPAPQAAAAIKARFAQQWRYSLQVSMPGGKARSLIDFLSLDRRGHCEYFATAATLAMRRLGYPARYATGYLVHEFDASENLYWVRARDGHAWSTYWNGESWQTLDATPPGQGEELDWDAPLWDQISRWRYALEEFDFGALGKRFDNGWIWLAACLALAGLILRLNPKRPPRQASHDERARELTARLQSLTGLTRNPNETSGAFWTRAGRAIPSRAAELARVGALRDQALYAPSPHRLQALLECEAQCARQIRELPRKLPKPRKP